MATEMVLTQSTIDFDASLLDYFKPARIRHLLNDWLREERALQRSILARDIIKAILYRSSDFFSRKGKKRLSEIMANCERFEFLIGHIRTRFQGLLYRDHLDHMIRTALLASYLVELFQLQCTESTVIASVFHDAGYPVQEASQILRSISESLKSGYSLLRFPEEFQASVRNPISCLEHMLQKTGINDELLQSMTFIRPDHGVIGAFEFLSCCSKCSPQAVAVAAAICLHSDKTDAEIRFSENPVAFLLTLADELQDWGRRAFYPDGESAVTMERLQGINRLGFSTNLIITMEYSPDNFPLLEVISSKHENLRRLRPDGFDHEIKICFPVERLHSIPWYSPYINLNIRDDGDSTLLGIRPISRNKWKVHWNMPKSGERIMTDAEVARYTNFSQEVVKRSRVLIQEHRIPSKKLQLEGQLDILSCYQYKRSSNYLIIDDRLEHVEINRQNDRIKLCYKTERRPEPVNGDLIQSDKLPPRVDEESELIQLIRAYHIVLRLRHEFVPRNGASTPSPRLFLILSEEYAAGELGPSIYKTPYAESVSFN